MGNVKLKGGALRCAPRRRRCTCRVVLAATAFIAASAASAAVAADFTLTSNTCPVCSTAQQQRFEFVIANQLGVAGRDPDGEYIGIWNAGRWEPQATYKQAMCGRLADFSFYDPWTSGDEADWNEYIVPSAPFQHLIDEPRVRNGGDTEDWNHERVIVNGQPQDRLAVEAEITPDEHFYENPWVSASSKDSALVGSDLCTYGPWVIDTGHNNRPEIHPSELHWWRAGSFTYMLNMQDDSNRFDNRDDYDLGLEPDSWREWSQFPRTGEFSVAVSLPASRVTAPIGGPPRFEISTDYLRNLAFTDSADADDGAEHGLTYNGTRLLSVVEGGRVADPAVDRFVKVGFNFCRAPGPTLLSEQLLGYVTLTSRAGLSDDGKEAVHLFKVRRVNDTGPGNAIVKQVARQKRPGLTADPRWLPSTLRAAVVGGKRRLIADVEVVARPGRKPRTGDRDIARVRVTGAPGPARRALRLGSAARSVRVSLPVASTAAVRLKARSGKTAVLDAEGLAPALLDGRDAPASAPSAANPAVVAAALGVPGGSLPDASTVRKWDVSVASMYAPVRRGAPSPEDDSPLTETLNEAVRNRGRRARALFGTTEPLKVRWSFVARDAVSGRAVRVRVNRPAAASEIAVRTGSPTRKLTVTFPATGTVYRLTATARTRDPFGARASTRHEMSNLVLSGADQPSLASSLLQSAARLAGVAPELLTAASPVTGVPAFDPNPSDVPATRMRGVSMLAYQVAEDRRVNLAELARVLGAAQRVAAGG
jgi:hypothetical protein